MRQLLHNTSPSIRDLVLTGQYSNMVAVRPRAVKNTPEAPDVSFLRGLLVPAASRLTPPHNQGPYVPGPRLRTRPATTHSACHCVPGPPLHGWPVTTPMDGRTLWRLLSRWPSHIQPGGPGPPIWGLRVNRRLLRRPGRYRANIENLLTLAVYCLRIRFDRAQPL